MTIGASVNLDVYDRSLSECYEKNLDSVHLQEKLGDSLIYFDALVLFCEAKVNFYTSLRFVNRAHYPTVARPTSPTVLRYCHWRLEFH